jgi:hypothetical protein
MKESLCSKLLKLFQLDSYFRHAALGTYHTLFGYGRGACAAADTSRKNEL